MRGVWLKWLSIAVLVLAAAGLAVAWFTVDHLVFTIIFCCVFLTALLLLATRDTYRQTSTENLMARGITPESVRAVNSIDSGLVREMTFISPRSATQWMFARRPPLASPARASASPRSTGTPRTMPNRQQGRGRRGNELLQPDATITLAAERRAAGIDDLFITLDKELVGLVPVKKKVEEIGSLLLVDRARQRFGLSASRPNLHMCFTGAPGTGKTTVALMMADLLHRLGYLEKGHLVHAMRDDLVGEYIGHTAPKTKQVLDRAMGGVLFIDEAYTLFRAEDSKDYGQECIDILLQVMENDRDKLVVILAGYQDRMDRFFDSNPGMSSRIAHHLDFPQYDLDELLAIGQLMLNQTSYYISEDAGAALRDYLSTCMNQPRFANARSVRNELDRARLKHAYRLAADPEPIRTKDDLMRLEGTDISPSHATVAGPDPDGFL
jgi:probable Rubsico expression protein CbbX